VYIAYLFINQKKKTTMKKIMIAFASALVLTACGTENTVATTTTTDSTTVVTDSTLVDTVAAQVDTTATVTEIVK
jgi:uncharacterized lipoprotein YajG